MLGGLLYMAARAESAVIGTVFLALGLALAVDFRRLARWKASWDPVLRWS
jgi:hypothetical protein